MAKARQNQADNPKTDPDPGSNTISGPEDWTTGEARMTGAQASSLKALSEEAGEAFDADLIKAEASKRIDALQAKTGRGHRAARSRFPRRRAAAGRHRDRARCGRQS